MPDVGDIKYAKELGYKDTHWWVYHSCEICGKLRWVQLVKGKPSHTKCIICSNNDVSNSRRDTIRNIWLGRIHTDESKQKIRESRLGTKLSEDTRAAISNALIGNKYNWQGGKTLIQQAV